MKTKTLVGLALAAAGLWAFNEHNKTGKWPWQAEPSTKPTPCVPCTPFSMEQATNPNCCL